VNAVVAAARLIVAASELGEEIANGGPRDDAYAVPHTTLGIGPVAGGYALNVVPDTCTFELEIRHLPGDDPARHVDRLRRAAAEEEARDQPGGRVAITIEETASYPGLETDGRSAVVAVAAELTGASPGKVSFGTEAGLYARELGGPVVVVGPGDMRDAHGADESVALEQLGRAERFVEAFVRRLAA
jgi:acetylornithine deacetylase